MGGYRAGLILAMPELDTHNTLERYAKNSEDPAAWAGFALLRRRTKLRADWDGLLQGGTKAGQQFTDFKLGVARKPSSDEAFANVTPASLLAMPTDERDQLYAQMCAVAGIKIDIEALKQTRTQSSSL